MEKPKQVKLKNGAKEQETGIRVTMPLLNATLEQDPILIYELRKKCEDFSHKCYGDSEEELKKRELLLADGKPHKTMVNIVLSAVKIDGANISIQNPIAED